MSASQLSPVGRFERILLATDGSEFGEGAKAVGLALAKLSGAKLRAMTMVFGNTEYEAVAPERARAGEAAAVALTDRIKGEAEAAGIACDTTVRHGDEPHREIVAEAAAGNFDVIVVGRRGRRGLARMMVGDATAKVIGAAQGAVLVCPKAAAGIDGPIVLGIDGSRSSDAAAIAAANLAKKTGQPVAVVGALKPSVNEARHGEIRAAVERVAMHLIAEGVAVETVVAAGQPDELLVRTAQARNAGLIVVGSHGKTGVAKLLMGSTVERVIGQTPCPVLVTKA